MTDTNGSKMTTEEIVAGLRNRSPEERNRAMDALFPGEQGALLIRSSAQQTETCATTECDAGRMFTALVLLAQRFGNHLGLQLQWVPEQPDPNKLEIAPGSLLEGPRGGPGAFR